MSAEGIYWQLIDDKGKEFTTSCLDAYLHHVSHASALQMHRMIKIEFLFPCVQVRNMAFNWRPKANSFVCSMITDHWCDCGQS